MILHVLFIAIIPCVLSEWTINVPLGKEVKLMCNDSRVMLQSDDTLMWKTPDEKVLSAHFNQSDYELRGTIGEELIIKNVALGNQGLYTCVIKSNINGEVRAYLLRGVNLSGPMYASLNEKYEENVIVAVIASAVFAVSMIGLCALEKFRYKDPSKNYRKGQTNNLSTYPEKKPVPAVVVSAYDNPAADFSTQL